MRTHDDLVEEYAPSGPGETPIVVDALRLEGVFPPQGCVNVRMRQHEDGYPVLVYECWLSDDDWKKVRRALDAIGKESR